jgi:hypothetical protein
MFPTESVSFSDLLREREASVRRTLREISYEELRSLFQKLFGERADPWAEEFSQFTEEHKSEHTVRGETSDGYAFVYYPLSNRGIWYENTGKAFAVGLLTEPVLKALAEILSEHRTGRSR